MTRNHWLDNGKHLYTCYYLNIFREVEVGGLRETADARTIVKKYHLPVRKGWREVPALFSWHEKKKKNSPPPFLPVVKRVPINIAGIQVMPFSRAKKDLTFLAWTRQARTQSSPSPVFRTSESDRWVWAVLTEGGLVRLTAERIVTRPLLADDGTHRPSCGSSRWIWGWKESQISL